jgi:hypothetical protein
MKKREAYISGLNLKKIPAVAWMLWHPLVRLTKSVANGHAPAGIGGVAAGSLVNRVT